MKNLVLYIGLPLVVLVLFKWQLGNLEKFFKKYPHAIDGTTLIFTLVTTTISIIIAYKSYTSNIKLFQDNKKEQSYKIQRLLKTDTKDLIHKLVGFHANYKYKKSQQEKSFIYDELKSLDLKNELQKMEKNIKEIRKDNIDSLISKDFEKIQDDLELISALEIYIDYYNTLYELIDLQDSGIDSLPESAQKQVKEHEETLMEGIHKLIERFKDI